MSDRVRIAVVGAGWWATFAHIPALQANPDVALVALCDRDSGKLARAATHYGIEKQYTDLDEMLERETLDGAVIAVWHAAHYEVARACLDRGLHILLEKPMVLTAVHARDLVERARGQDREIIMGYPWHYTSPAQQARSTVQSGGIGQVQYVVDIFASSPYNLYKGDDRRDDPRLKATYPVNSPGDVYADPARSGGGQGHLQVTHSAALMFFITGLKPVTVQAQMSRLDVAVDVIDAITVWMDNGALATVGSTGAVVSGAGKLDVQVYGDRGWIDLDFMESAGRIRYADGREETLVNDGDAYPHYAPANNLADVILGRDDNRSPAEPGWRTVEMLDAAYRSVGQNGALVDVASLYG